MAVKFTAGGKKSFFLTYFGRHQPDIRGGVHHLSTSFESIRMLH